MRIETDRLIIRSFAKADIPGYAAIVADPVVMRFLGGPISNADAAEYIEDVVRRDASTGIARFAVVLKDTGELIGFCGFKDVTDYVDFGWRYAKHVWNQGFGSEAALAVLDYGLDTLKLENISAGTFVDNTASLRIIESLGFEGKEDTVIQGKAYVRYYQQAQRT